MDDLSISFEQKYAKIVNYLKKKSTDISWLISSKNAQNYN